MADFTALQTMSLRQQKKLKNTVREVIIMRLIVPKKIYGITELYDAVAMAMGHKDTSELHYDCRAINVAMNIQENFFRHYREDNIEMSENDFKMSMAMLLLNYGPKTDEALEDYEVEVFAGFIQ
jgi:hypothetical protein